MGYLHVWLLANIASKILVVFLEVVDISFHSQAGCMFRDLSCLDLLVNDAPEYNPGRLTARNIISLEVGFR